MMKKILAAAAVSMALVGSASAEDGLNMGNLAANAPAIVAGLTMLVIVGSAVNSDSSSTTTTN